MPLILFGSVFGILWAALVGLLLDKLDLNPWTYAAIPAGAATGVLVTFGLRGQILRGGMGRSVVLAIGSLPLAGFVFGFLLEFALLALAFCGMAESGFVPRWFAPFTTGIGFAVLSVMSLYTLLFVPFAVGTTLLLRARLRRMRID